MNVKQRHDAQRNIFVGKRVGVRDVGSGNSQIEMAERNALGTPGAAAGVQDQGNIVWGGLDRLFPRRSIVQMHNAFVGHPHREHRDLEIGGRAAGELGSYRRTEQNFCVGVAEEKYKLFVGICRI